MVFITWCFTLSAIYTLHFLRPIDDQTWNLNMWTRNKGLLPEGEKCKQLSPIVITIRIRLKNRLKTSTRLRSFRKKRGAPTVKPYGKIALSKEYNVKSSNTKCIFIKQEEPYYVRQQKRIHSSKSMILLPILACTYFQAVPFFGKLNLHRVRTPIRWG